MSDNNFANRSTAHKVPGTRCDNGESVFDAAKKRFGENVFVDTSRNSHHFDPNPQTVAQHGNPVGEVTVRAKESFWVFSC